MDVHLVGGVLDGYCKPRETRLPETVWAQADGDGSKMTVRFFKEPKAGVRRVLYKLDEERRKSGRIVQQTFLCAQHTTARCTGCGGLHRLPAERCTLCGGELGTKSVPE